MGEDLVSLAAEVTPYVSAAVSAHGGAVLADVPDEAADSTVSLGCHVLRQMFGPQGEGKVLPDPLADLAASPHDGDALAAVRMAIRKALAADPVLEAKVRSMLAGAAGVRQQVLAARDAYTAGRDLIVNYTGDLQQPAGSMRSADIYLSLVKDAKELDARVNHAVEDVPYIHRDIEGQARRYLQEGLPVLLVGSSMVGKTRVAVSLIRERFADRALVMPDSLNVLASLDAADPKLRGAVLFLDDINRLIGVEGITDGTIHRLVAAGSVIVATIRAADYDRYQATDRFRSPEWDVLSLFKRVFLTRDLSRTEEDRLRAAVPDLKVRERIIRTGLGEYVGAAERIDEVLRYGASVCPVGYALVKGAADWRCAGMKAPVPPSLLPSLAESHLTGSDRLRLSDEGSYKAALRWATRYINPTVSLLQRHVCGSFSIFDYALDVLAQPGDPIPNATWQILLQYADPDDLIGVGYTAEVIFGKSEVALQAWLRAAESGHADGAPVAACNLAVLAQNRGDLKAAREACQRAMESGHADHAPMAAVNLGILLQQQGDLEGAQVAYQHAIDSGHFEHAPRAWLGRGILLHDKGDIEGARAAYLRAAESGHTDTVGKAKQRLNKLDADRL